jgi:hypothetical protein
MDLDQVIEELLKIRARFNTTVEIRIEAPDLIDYTMIDRIEIEIRQPTPIIHIYQTPIC